MSHDEPLSDLGCVREMERKKPENSGESANSAYEIWRLGKWTPSMRQIIGGRANLRMSGVAF